MGLFPLSLLQRSLLFGVSLVLVAFGQPAWSWWIGLIAAVVGYALIWRVLLDISRPLNRFLTAAAWFTLVQYVQLSWSVSHPYFYIYFIYTFFAASMGVQFGLLGLLITPRRIQSVLQIVAIASLWTLLEWSRLFFLSGMSWNPAGLALTGSLYPLQMASLWGVFGLTFWVMFVNLLVLRAWCKGIKLVSALACLLLAAVPYIYGGLHLNFHDNKLATWNKPLLNAVLVQTAFPAEHQVDFSDRKLLIAHVIKQWKEILRTVKKQQGKRMDLMVLPEYAVACGTYSCVFPYTAVRAAFSEIFGEESTKTLPPLETPFAKSYSTEEETVYLVNNAFWAQGLANHFDTGVVIGLEDAEISETGEKEHYSAALFFRPSKEKVPFEVDRYEKRVLVPLGEYIPFAFCKAMAADYGITGSFTCGTEAKVFNTHHAKIPFGISICYEETFGHLMRENKFFGAELLVNLTSDAWYPNSRLPQQHLTHSLLRTVESGIPLIRSSNIGVTCAVDSFGRVISMVGDGASGAEWLVDSMHVAVPTYHYATVYSHLGDSLIIGFCFITSLFIFRSRPKKSNLD